MLRDWPKPLTLTDYKEGMMVGGKRPSDGLVGGDVKRSQDPSQVKIAVHVTQRYTPVKRFFVTAVTTQFSRQDLPGHL